MMCRSGGGAESFGYHPRYWSFAPSEFLLGSILLHAGGRMLLDGGCGGFAGSFADFEQLQHCQGHLVADGEQSGSFFRLGITDTCTPRKT